MQQIRELVAAIQSSQPGTVDSISEVLGSKPEDVHSAIEWLRSTGIEITRAGDGSLRLLSDISLLSNEAVRCQLDDTSSRLLGSLHILDVIDSTSDWLKSIKSMSRVPGEVCLAEFQRSGRGRHGRQWQSAYGSGLCLSISWCLSNDASSVSGLSLAMAVAVSRFLSQLGMFDHQLKWPNDVLIGDRKLAGILVEIVEATKKQTDVVIGIGMNVHQPGRVHDQVDRPMVDLSTTMPDNTLDRSQLAGLLIHHCLMVLHEFTHNGFDSLRDEWQQRDALRGRHVRMKYGDNSLEGRASGISACGKLRLDTAQGLVELSGGEVSIVRTGRE